MKRLTLLLSAAVLLVASCSPETFTMNIDMRYPSRSGLDLSKKSMAIVYVDEGKKSDESFVKGLASGFAYKLEEEYFGGHEAIELFSVPKDSSVYTKKFMEDMVMDSGKDVIFLIDTPEYGTPGAGENKRNPRVSDPDSSYLCSVLLPFKINVSAFDSMDKNDKVLQYSGSSAVRTEVANPGAVSDELISKRLWDNITPEAEKVGVQATGNFLSTWKTERYTLYYYNSADTRWDKASQAAYEYRWQEAIKTWCEILKSTSNHEKKACLCYNIATACYMLGDYTLAISWLDTADKECELNLSQGLRSRIAQRKK